MKDLREIYKNGINENSRYISAHYNMIGQFTEKRRELEKCYYMDDLEKRQTRLRELLKDKTHKQGVIKRQPRQTFLQHTDLGINIEQYKEFLKTPMFYGIDIWIAYKRETELHNYIEKIIKHANKLIQKKNTETAIFYLVDERFNWHTGVFDDEIADYFYRAEYNQFIFDVLRLRELEIWGQPIAYIDQNINPIRKPLEWRGKKTAIGTIFGVLHREGLIKGTKSDLIRCINYMFSGLSENTLRDNINLKENPNDLKILYDTKIPALMSRLIGYLKK